MSPRVGMRERVLKGLHKALSEAGLNPGEVVLYAKPSDCEREQGGCSIDCVDETPLIWDDDCDLRPIMEKMYRDPKTGQVAPESKWREIFSMPSLGFSHVILVERDDSGQWNACLKDGQPIPLEP